MESSSYDVVLYLRSGYNTVLYYFSTLIDFIQNYAWTILFLSIIFYYVYTNYLKYGLRHVFKTYDGYMKQKEEQEYAAKYHKNPDLYAQRISMQQQAAQKLQEKYNSELKEHEKKLQEKMEQKRQEIEEKLDNFGHKLGSNSDSEKPKSLKTEYNPLMGPGPSSSYRPPKKSKCGGGGCGK